MTLSDTPEWIYDEKDVLALKREEVLQPLIDADNIALHSLQARPRGPNPRVPPMLLPGLPVAGSSSTRM